MYRAVRVLRIALPIAFVAFLALIGAMYSSNRVRNRPVSQPETSTIRKESPQSIAYQFEDTQTVGGKVLSKIRARRTMGFASGWYTLEDVELTIYREPRTYQLVAPQAQFHVESKSAEVKKGVRLTSSSGITVQTEEMKFDGKNLTSEIPLTFSAQNWTGKAGGIDLYLEQEKMFLKGGVEATTKPAGPNEPPLVITSRLAEFDQPKGEVTFRDDVVLNRVEDTLNTEAITAKVDQSHEFLVGLGGCCEVLMKLREGSPLLPKEMTGAGTIKARSFHSEVGPRGEIRAITALGSPAKGLFQGPPRRDLDAESIRIGLAAEQISDIRAEGNVLLKETVRSALRTLRAKQLTLYLDPKTQRLSSAAARESIVYRDPKSSATAQQANYDMQNELLVLSTVKEDFPRITSQGHTLRANTIEVSQKESVLRGRGSVSAQLSSDEKGVTASETALFPREDGPVFVNSDSLVLRQVDKTAAFTGKVRAWQGNNVLFADSLQVEAAGEVLNARDNVRALLYNIRGEKRKNPISAKSDVLMARRSERKIDLVGNVRIDDEPRSLTADRASIFLDANRRVERIEADSNLVVTEKSTGRRATANHVIYRLAEKTILLDGTPAVVTEPRGVVKGKQIVFDIARNTVNVVGEMTEATYHPQ